MNCMHVRSVYWYTSRAYRWLISLVRRDVRKISPVLVSIRKRSFSLPYDIVYLTSAHGQLTSSGKQVLASASLATSLTIGSSGVVAEVMVTSYTDLSKTGIFRFTAMNNLNIKQSHWSLVSMYGTRMTISEHCSNVKQTFARKSHCISKSKTEEWL